MDNALRTEYRDYAWKYFSLHADQRLKTFNFFIVISTFLIGSFGALISQTGLQTLYVLLPIFLVFVSFVFWKLEERNRMLVKNGEQALKLLDEEALSNETNVHKALALFAVDELASSSLSKNPFWSGYFSYSRCFRWVYGAVSLLGIAGISFCVMAP